MSCRSKHHASEVAAVGVATAETPKSVSPTPASFTTASSTAVRIHPWFPKPAHAQRARDSETFTPSDEWREAFRAQSNQAMLDGALAWATRRARAVRLSLTHDDLADLVQNVLVQTASGEIRWRHERVSLLDHVCDTIRRRISRRVSRPKKNRFHRLDVLVIANSEDEPTAETEGVLVQLAGPDERDCRAMVDLVGQVLGPLEEALARRPSARKLLDAYLHQITDPREVMKHTGMSKGELRHARRGLMLAVRTLPSEVRTAVHSILNKV